MKTEPLKLPWKELREQIKTRLTEGGKKLHSLTTDSGLSWGTISTAFDPKTNDVKLGTLVAILKAVNLELHTGKIGKKKP